MFARRLFTVALAVGALIAPSAAHAAAARGPVLDPSFGTGGWVSNDHGGGDSVLDVAIQPDGKILALGNANEGYFGIERHLPDGSLDNSFGTSGLVVTDADPDSFWDEPKAITLLPDGRFLVAGSVARAGFGAPVVIRYRADGSVDTTFGVDGRAFPALGVDGHLGPRTGHGPPARRQESWSPSRVSPATAARPRSPCGCSPAVPSTRPSAPAA